MLLLVVYEIGNMTKLKQTESEKFRLRIGRRVKLLRESRNLYQKTLADAIGAKAPTIHYIEAGEKVSIKNVAKLATFFGVTIESLIEERPGEAEEVETEHATV